MQLLMNGRQQYSAEVDEPECCELLDDCELADCEFPDEFEFCAD